MLYKRSTQCNLCSIKFDYINAIINIIMLTKLFDVFRHERKITIYLSKYFLYFSLAEPEPSFAS